MAKEDWSEAKAWMRATRERIGMTQHDAAVLANLTVDMVKKYESEKYRIQPSGRMREMLEHYLAEHRRAVVAIVERHRGDERAVLSFSRVSDLPEGLPDWVRAEESVKRRAAASVRPSCSAGTPPRNRKNKENACNCLNPKKIHD
jgi:transcriptional regulator with XRE-family HTH domain